MAICSDRDATLDDLREAETTLEDVARTARRVLGGANPTAVAIADSMRRARVHLAWGSGDARKGRCLP